METTFDTVDQGFSYLESFTNLEKNLNYTARTYRLDRVEVLSEYFGRPQDSFRVLHLAGSKGKGSTAIYLARALTLRGYKTGLYTSPHVTTYKERISLAGEFIDDDVFITEMNHIRKVVNTLKQDSLPGGGDPTTFELMTLLAFLVYRRLKCSWVVLETGMGGRLDATNIVTPEAVFLTPIELEHTEYLGHTIGEIAGEKAGIIKQAVPVFCADQKPEALEVFRRTAAERECPFFYLPEHIDSILSETTPEGEKVAINWMADDKGIHQGRQNDQSLWTLKMLGSHQAQNAALAALGLKILFARRGKFPADVMAEALAEASLPGRMEIIEHHDSTFIFDGAHTPISVGLAARTFEELGGKGGILIFGTAKGKAVPPLAGELHGLFSTVIISRAGQFKPEDPEKVYQEVKAILEDEDVLEAPSSIPAIEFIPEPREAYSRALELSGKKKPILVTGSFYMAGAIRNCLSRD